MVLLDLDGTLLDSAPGIVDGYAHALAAVGVAVPAPHVLRSDVGPPVEAIMARHGVPPCLLDAAVAAYRRRYLDHGIHDSSVYPGVREALASLRPHVRLATATAKRVDTARRILAVHDLGSFFEVLGGSTDAVRAKADIVAATLAALGGPDPATVLMVGDRSSDVVGARARGVRTAAVTWGYGGLDELEAAGPDHLLASPAELVALATSR